MRILHWNIHGWADADGVDNVDRVIEVIRDGNPDVVSLVEVDERWGRPVNLQRVAGSLGYHWTFVPVFEYREAGGFGNALLSRQPFSSVRQWHLLPPMLYDGTEPTEPRAVTLAEVETSTGSLLVGSTHFPRSDDARRKHASDRLLDLLLNAASPYMICGDFNQPASAWVPDDMTIAPNDLSATYPVAAPAEPIDYCLASGVLIEDVSLITTTASDHFPIATAISIT